MFKYETSVSKQPTRPTNFKLAYTQNASSQDKVEFGSKSCKKAKIYHKKSNDKFWNPCTYIVMCISMICIYLMKQVNKWQPVGLPTSTSGFVKLYAKVKMAPETCQMVKKHYDQSNDNFWDIYGYVKMYVCMIYMYLTKQVNRLQLVGLLTKTSDLAKLYTLDKIGTESCQMVKKHNHKFHNKFWNAYSYLRRRIMEFGKYLRTVISGRRSRRPLATPPTMGYIRRTETGGWQSGSDHSHPMVSVMSLLLNLLFLFCMHLITLRYLTVCLIYLLFGFVALNLIWLYDYWHIYIYDYLHMNIAKMENLRTPFAIFHLIMLHLLCFCSPSFPRSLSLSLSSSFYFISFSVISQEPGIAGNSVLGDCLRQLFLAFFDDSDPGITGNSVPDRNLQCSTSSFLLIVGHEPDIAGNSVSGEDFRQLSLVSLGGFESGIAGNSISDKNLPYSITLLPLSFASSSLLLFPFFFSLSLSPPLYFISFSVMSHEPGIAGNSVLGDCLRQLFLAFFDDSDPGIAGNSVPDRNLQYYTSSFLLIVGYEPDIAGNSVSGEDLRLLSLSSLGGFKSGIAGNSVSDKNLPYSITLLSLSLHRSGKGPCIMHPSKKMRWKDGSKYITPIQPYRFCKQLYPCYQIRLCSVIQLNCEDVLVVIWFPVGAPFGP